jgi:hypothetical protein
VDIVSSFFHVWPFSMLCEQLPDPPMDSLCFPEAYALSQDPMRLVLWLQHAGVLKGDVTCRCGRLMKLGAYNNSGDKVCWRCPQCKRHRSIRSASFFAKSSMPLGMIFMVMFLTLKFPKMLGGYVTEIAETSENTVSQWGIFIRESISHFLMKNPVLFDAAHPVQVDESLFGGKRKYHQGSHREHIKSWVFGIVQEGMGRNVLWMVKKQNAKTLMSIIEDHVAMGATIKSDEWNAYGLLGMHGYNHLTVNHSVHFVNERGIHTQLVESLWSQVKSSLCLKRGTRARHLPGYLDLYSFRCEALFEGRDVFEKFLGIIQIGNIY